MVVFPNAKINLGLWIVERRPDGYHNLESCFYPVPWKDALEFIESDNTSFSTSGLPIPGTVENNLVLKAYDLLKGEHKLPELHIHLHKQIPMGAGLGGGSSDAAFFLKAISNYFDLNLSTEKLVEMAGKLGADCPFFIENSTRLVKGTGDVFEPIQLSLEGLWLTLIYPDVHISTGEAFASITPGYKEKDLREILSQPVDEWKGHLTNDFEDYAFQVKPLLRDIKEELYKRGGSYASMSGSGSTLYALSNSRISTEDLPYLSFSTQL